MVGGMSMGKAKVEMTRVADALDQLFLFAFGFVATVCVDFLFLRLFTSLVNVIGHS